MMTFSTIERARADIVSVSRYFHDRGWASSTSSNFSIRLSESEIALTRSGVDKGRLTEADVIRASLERGAIEPASARPSAEALLHYDAYRRFEDVGCVLHVHSPAATVISRLALDRGEVRLSDYEMLKALSGVDTHDYVERVPVVANSQDMHSIVRALDDRLPHFSRVHGYLIAGHGLYAWGADVDAARHSVEALEFLFDCELRAWRANA